MRLGQRFESARIACTAGLDRQRGYKSFVVAFANVLVESPRLDELHGFLDNLKRVRLEDQLLAPAEGGVVIVAFGGGRNVTLPQVQIPFRITFKGLLGQPQRSEVPTKRLLAYCRRHPERDQELALRQLTQPSRFRDRDLGVKEIGCLNVPLVERYQPLSRPTSVHGLYVLLRQHLARGLQGREVAAGHLPDTNRHIPEFVEEVAVWVMIRANEYGRCQQSVGRGRGRSSHITIPIVMRSGAVRSESLTASPSRITLGDWFTQTKKPPRWSVILRPKRSWRLP